MGQQTSLMCGGIGNFIGDTLVINWLLRDKLGKETGGRAEVECACGRSQGWSAIAQHRWCGSAESAKDSSRHAALVNMLNLASCQHEMQRVTACTQCLE